MQNFPQLSSFDNSVFRFSVKLSTTFKFQQFSFSVFCKIFRNFQVPTIRFFGFMQNFPQLSSLDNSVFRFSVKFSATFKFQQFSFSVFCKTFRNFQISAIRLFWFLQTFPHLSSFDDLVFGFLHVFSQFLNFSNPAFQFP